MPQLRPSNAQGIDRSELKIRGYFLLPELDGALYGLSLLRGFYLNTAGPAVSADGSKTKFQRLKDILRTARLLDKRGLLENNLGLF